MMQSLHRNFQALCIFLLSHHALSVSDYAQTTPELKSDYTWITLGLHLDYAWITLELSLRSYSGHALITLKLKAL